jgi:hypothetical protein
MRAMLRRLFSLTSLPWWIFALLGTFFVALGLIFAAPTVIHLFTFERADGRVIDYTYSGDVVYPIVQFNTPDGRRWEFEEDWGSSPPEFKLEQKVDVRYDPANPRNAFINSFINLWILSGIFWLVGGVFAVIGWAGVFSAYRRQRVS